MDRTSPNGIVWPARYDPANAPVHVRNELAMPDVPAEVAWAWLIRAPQWPDWYPNAANVRVPGNRDLALGTNFCWRTFGVTISSTVREFVPNERIAWDAQALGLDVYHAWLIERRQSGCWVLTEETQYGFLARLSHRVMPNRMHKYHQIWLERLQACGAQAACLADTDSSAR